MKTPAQWVKERDFLGGEYDTKERMMALISEVQADALADYKCIVCGMDARCHGETCTAGGISPAN